MKNLIDWALAMKQVNKYTRVNAITCQSCGLIVKKEKWLIVDDKNE